MSILAIAIAAALTIVVVAVILFVDQVHKRRFAEDELTFHRARADVLEDQVPFPYGETMPK